MLIHVKTPRRLSPIEKRKAIRATHEETIKTWTALGDPDRTLTNTDMELLSLIDSSRIAVSMVTNTLQTKLRVLSLEHYVRIDAACDGFRRVE
jgi:hypothetical protein